MLNCSPLQQPSRCQSFPPFAPSLHKLLTLLPPLAPSPQLFHSTPWQCLQGTTGCLSTPGWPAVTAHWEKEKHFIYFRKKCNKRWISERYLEEQLFHLTMDFLSFLQFSLPLCYSYDKPTYATGLKTDCKQPEQRLSRLVCTRPTTMEPLSCLQTSSTAIIQILLIMIVNVE